MSAEVRGLNAVKIAKIYADLPIWAQEKITCMI